MPFPLLGVPVHLQDDPDGCALACGQMVARFVTNVLLQQTDLQVLPPDPVWAVSPAQLEQGLNAALAAQGSAVQYTVYAETSTDVLMNRVAMALDASLPAIVLTSTQEHWVVVHGITATKSSLTIHIRNPLPDREDAMIGVNPLPPHTDSDNCPTLEILNSGEFDGEIVSCQDWEHVYLVKSAYAPVAGKYVVAVPTQSGVPSGIYSCVAPSDDKGIPASDTIGELAWSRLMETSVLTRDGWNRLAGPPPDFASVRQLRVVDPTDAASAFLLVEVKGASGVVVLIRLDANTGAFLGAILNPSDRLTTALFSPSDQVPWLRRLKLPPGRPTRVVWTYGSTSLYSPFVPLLEVSLPTGIEYVRLFDGKVFNQLQAYDRRRD